MQAYAGKKPRHSEYNSGSDVFCLFTAKISTAVRCFQLGAVRIPFRACFATYIFPSTLVVLVGTGHCGPPHRTHHSFSRSLDAYLVPGRVYKGTNYRTLSTAAQGMAADRSYSARPAFIRGSLGVLR